MRIPVNAPVIPASAREQVLAALDAGWLSGTTPVVAEFEARFAEWIGVRHAIACASGTAALELVLAGLGIGPGDEVIVPDLSIIAPAAAVLRVGAKPVLVDVEADTGTLDPDAVARAIGPRTRALLPVHLYGHPAAMDRLLALAECHGLMLIEDAAEAHGTRWQGRLCGNLGHAAAFSFYANKLITTGEGGMVTTDDAALAARIRSLRDLAHRPGARFHHDEIGYSLRMSSLQAALGLGQLEHSEAFLAHKRWMAATYGARLAHLPGLVLPCVRRGAESSHWMYAIRIGPDFPMSRDALMAALADRGIETRPAFTSLSRQPALVDRLGPMPRCPNAEAWADSGLYLPSGLALTPEQLHEVCHALEALGTGAPA
jgi:perosamine synthetase